MKYILKASLTGTDETELLTADSARITLANNTVYRYIIYYAGKRTDIDGEFSGQGSGRISRGATASTVAISPEPIIIDTGSTDILTIAESADTTNGALKVTGQLSAGTMTLSAVVYLIDSTSLDVIESDATAQANQIITKNDAKEVLGIKLSDTALDSLLVQWCNAVSDYIEKTTGRMFKARDVDEVIDGDGSCELFTPYNPIVGYASTASTEELRLACVQYRNDPTESWANLETDSRYFFFDSTLPSCIRSFQTVFTKGTQNIRLNLQRGYSSIPADIRNLALEMIQYQYNLFKIGRDWLGKGSMSASNVGNDSTSLKEPFERWEKVLFRHRNLA